ncbi:low molecular weight phosphatase family protein [Paenarthrobacter sp. PH39-S1]|uniref:arsenate-mycothiol transferase ArsC n=1 Tax=Paenarthrobacter sp. PH39-S1 TaxID=3046204 RepID=UPI0024BA2474|nr:low molecular weight phosphatase family protein [Paenarthrobacter sp. PH39-S1]MDJ0356585.1 low molecular weight phosphatase family protein [Paenarthrobacter sp. PH39-S1]
MTSKPGVLFVCVKNGGKSQVAGGLMRHLTGDTVTVYTAGTKPGSSLNAQSVKSLTELGIDISDEHTKPITAEMLANVDLIVTLGKEAVVDPVPGIEIRNWDTDEPSERGIEGMERMRLIRDDIQVRVQVLTAELSANNN